MFKAVLALTLLAGVLSAQQKSETGIRHSIVCSGSRVFELGEDDAIVWEYTKGSRDASKLANGNYLITYADKIVEVTPSKEIVWQYKSSVNKELMSAQRLADGLTVVTELVPVRKFLTICVEISYGVN